MAKSVQMCQNIYICHTLLNLLGLRSLAIFKHMNCPALVAYKVAESLKCFLIIIVTLIRFTCRLVSHWLLDPYIRNKYKLICGSFPAESGFGTSLSMQHVYIIKNTVNKISTLLCVLCCRIGSHCSRLMGTNKIIMSTGIHVWCKMSDSNSLRRATNKNIKTHTQHKEHEIITDEIWTYFQNIKCGNKLNKCLIR